MASPGITGPSEARLIISNDFLDNAANDGVEIDIQNITPINAFLHVSATKKLPKAGIHGVFEPRGISFNYGVGDQGGVDEDTTEANATPVAVAVAAFAVPLAVAEAAFAEALKKAVKWSIKLEFSLILGVPPKLYV